MPTRLPPLIGLAHGSRDPRAARMIGEVMRAVAGIAARTGCRPGVPGPVRTGPRQLPSPALRQDDRSSEAIVLPLLFSEAFHATVDAPTAVREAQAATGVSLRLGGILGMGEDVLLALEDSAAACAHLRARGDPAARRRVEPGRGERRRCTTWPTGGAGVGSGRCGPASPPPESRRPPPFSNGRQRERRRIGVVPLFLAPGLLLDATARQAMAIDAEVARAAGYRAGRPGAAAVRRGADRGQQRLNGTATIVGRRLPNGICRASVPVKAILPLTAVISA